MAWIDVRSFLESTVDQLQSGDLDGLKYVLKENFTGKFHSSDFVATSQGMFRIFGFETISWFS